MSHLCYPCTCCNRELINTKIRFNNSVGQCIVTVPWIKWKRKSRYRIDINPEETLSPSVLWTVAHHTHRYLNFLNVWLVWLSTMHHCSGVTNWFRSIVGRNQDGKSSSVSGTERLPQLQLQLLDAADGTSALQLPNARSEPAYFFFFLFSHSHLSGKAVWFLSSLQMCQWIKEKSLDLVFNHIHADRIQIFPILSPLIGLISQP